MQLSRAVLAAVVLVVLVSIVGAQPSASRPGFKITLSANGVNYAREVAVAYLTKALAVLNIPNQAGQDNAPVVGTIDWALTNIFLVGFNIPVSGIVFNPGIGVTMALDGGIAGQFNFYYKQMGWPYISGSGTIDVFFSGVYIETLLVMSEANGRPDLGVAQINVGISNEVIQVHGPMSWLYQFVVDVLAGPIKGWTIDAVRNGIVQALDQGANAALQTIPIIQKLGNIVELDYSMVAPAVFAANYVTYPCKGEFYSIASPSEAPYTPTQMPDIVTSEMFQAFFNDYVPNSAAWVYYKSGVLQATLQDKDLPSWSPLRLNTTSFMYIIPQLYKQYPNMLMEAEILAVAPPVTTFNQAGVTVDGETDIKVSVIDGSKLVDIFTIGLNISTSAKLYMIPGNNIAAELHYINSTFGLVYSKYGSFNFSLLNEAIELVCKNAIVPFLNEFLKIGINIPTIEGVTFVNPTIGYGNGYVYVSTDLTYTPPESAPTEEEGTKVFDSPIFADAQKKQMTIN